MQLFRDAKYITSSVFVGLLMSGVRSVLVLRILGPDLMGCWKSALLPYIAAEFARLGVSRAVAIRVPVLDGQNKKSESDRTASAAGTFLLFVGGILGLGIFTSGFFFSSYELRRALWFAAALVAVSQPYYLLRDLAAARHRFDLRAKETLMATTIDLIGAVVLSKLFRLPGLGTATVLAVLIPVLYLRRQQNFRFRLRAELSGVKELIRTGWPFSLTEAAFELTRRIDVLLIALLLGTPLVGYYGINLLVMDFAAVMAQKGVSQVLSPHLLREYGRTGSLAQVATLYEMPARLFCYVLPPLLGLGAMLIPGVVPMVLPQYVPGIEAAAVSMWAIFFVAVHSSMSGFIVAAEKVPATLKLFALLVPASAAAQYCVLKAGMGLPGAAWTTLLTLAVMATGEVCIARRSCGHSLSEIAGFLASLYFPLAASMILTILVGFLNFGWWLPTPVEPLLKALLFLIFYAPVLIAYENRFSILRTVRQTM